MKIWYVGLVLVFVVGVLAGCGGGEATPASADEDVSAAYVSEALDTSYENALNASSQLVLGTLHLEGTENAVTPEQATAMLPLWQALRGGVTARAEVSAVLKQVEGTMTQEQLVAIAAMQLTQEDLRAWMEEQGIGMGGGFPGAGGDMSEEERQALRATRQAGSGGEGMFPGGGEMPPEMATRRAEFENMGEEERAALRETMQAGGGFPGGSGAGGGGGRGAGQFMLLLNPLIELLTGRAAG
ncbi:MAG: hypothetical protein SXV54_22240 [Chloroflexota bacterium]|nr:hypothetical protein [Chloroflexota bacterium]